MPTNLRGHLSMQFGMPYRAAALLRTVRGCEDGPGGPVENLVLGVNQETDLGGRCMPTTAVIELIRPGQRSVDEDVS